MPAKSNEIISAFPPYKIERIVWYNLVERLGQFITGEERAEYEKIIDLDFIKRNSLNWKDYLSSKVKQNNVVLLGEAHTSEMVEKNAFTEFLYQAKNCGITDIGLEIRGEYQEAFDRFLLSGKFSENDNPSDYEKIFEYHELRDQFYKGETEIEINRILMDLAKLTKSLHGNFLYDHLIYEYYPIIKRARELDLKIRCLDANPNYLQEEFQLAIKNEQFDEWKQKQESERDKTMYENIKRTVSAQGRKMLVLVGSAHIGRGGFQYKNLGDLLENDLSLTSFRINIDKDIDSDFIMAEEKSLHEGVNFNSVLYNLLAINGFGGIGFDLSREIIKNDEVTGDFPFDGYVKC